MACSLSTQNNWMTPQDHSLQKAMAAADGHGPALLACATCKLAFVPLRQRYNPCHHRMIALLGPLAQQLAGLAAFPGLQMLHPDDAGHSCTQSKEASAPDP